VLAIPERLHLIGPPGQIYTAIS